MDWKRISSSILGVPMVLIILFLGNKYAIDIAFSIVAIISLHEYYRAFEAYKPVKWVGYIVALGISFIHFIPTSLLFQYIGLMIPFVIFVLFVYLILKDLKISIIDIAITLFGIFYIVIFTMFLPLIAGTENGKILIWYAFIIAWGTDIFAFVTGGTLKLGKHKFSKISPNKSIEGCIVGFIGAILLAIYYTFLINQLVIPLEISYLKIGIIAAVLSIVSQFGDFAASSIKRFVGIKDFSNLIPGHGGLLDRIDSLIFIAPFAYILLNLI